MEKSRVKRIHFIAIGGAAMHNLAIALSKKGYHVTGSDDEIFEPSRSRLLKYGLLPDKEGWDTSKITADIDAVILGMHARKDNPELLASLQLDLPVYSYPAYVYEQTRGKRRVVIGGSHGKTTVTSMIMHVLNKQNIGFDYLVGSIVEGFETMVNLDEESKVAVIEGDEYLSSPLDPTPKFHHYKPDVAILTGIAWDHINVFPTIEEYNEQFEKFIETMQPGGTLIFYKHDVVLSSIVQEVNPTIEKIAYDAHESVYDEGQTSLIANDSRYAVGFFGKHNMENVMAAKLVCQQLGIQEKDFYESITSFSGAGRRLQEVTGNDQSKMYIDFAHSPSKLKATIAAVKEKYPDKQLVACMELHTFSSLERGFLEQYKGTMEKADVPVVYYNPATVEHKKLELFNPSDVNKAFNDKRLLVFNEPMKLYNYLMALEYKNSVLLMMSSGNFSGIEMKNLEKKFHQQ